MTRITQYDVYSNVTIEDVNKVEHKINLHKWSHLIITGDGSVTLNFYQGPTIIIDKIYYDEIFYPIEDKIQGLHKIPCRVHGVVFEEHSLASIYEDRFADPPRWIEPNTYLPETLPLKFHLALLEAKRIYKGYTL